jgi:hypothetical protein
VRPVIQWGSALAEDLTHKPEDLLTVARPCRTLTGFLGANAHPLLIPAGRAMSRQHQEGPKSCK